MIEFTVTDDVIGLVVTSLIALIAGAWFGSALIPGKRPNEFDTLVAAFAVFATLVALVLAFSLAIEGGVS
jgi:hypothetical protein